MKTCTTCKKSKETSEFSVNKRMKDGLSNYCKQCLSEYRAKRYQENKDEVLAGVSAQHEKHRNRNRDFIVSFLKENPCVDCGESDIVVLEFDHVRGEKIRGIGYMVSNAFSLKKIKEEILKCEVRCANCHRRMTAARGNWYRTL